jgi:beta-xylosidase
MSRVRNMAHYRVLTLAACFLLILTGCGAVGNAAASRKTFKNPVYAHDFPDPFVLKVGKVYYAYATNTNSEDIPVIHSRDLVHWTGEKESFPVPPRWVSSNIWAPDVMRRSDGKYVLYYAGSDTAVSHECLGHAVSKSPAGPFIDRSSKAFVCQASLGGDIDPDTFKDTNGHLYLLWKNDGNCCGLDTYLYSQRLASSGLKLLGKPVKLLKEDAGWEGNLIEAPFMWKQAGKYYLFFSANNYASFDYAVGYAICKGPQGPCKDGPGNPILSSKCKAAGPGGETIIRDARGHTWMLYHAWNAGAVGDPTVGRQLWLDRLLWEHGKPVVHGPTCTAQPVPAT